MALTMNMRSVTVQKFADFVEMGLRCEEYDIPYIGIGKAGVGKTECLKELAKKLNIGYKEIRLVNMTETDLIGVPKVVNVAGKDTTSYASNDLLPYVERDGEVGILVLDEITSAQPGVTATALQILDSSRGVGNYKLPEKWMVVAIGNGPDDGGVFNNLPMALINRCVACRVEPDLKAWKGWAIKNNVDPTVLAFVSNDPSTLHMLPPEDSPNPAEVFPSPRSWTKLSTMLKNRQKLNGGMLDPSDVGFYAAFVIGENLSHKFEAFYAYNSKMIDINTIIDGTAPTNLQGISTEVVYLTAQNLVHNINEILQTDVREHGSVTEESATKLTTICDWVADISLHTADLAMMILQDISANIPLFNDVVLDPSFGSMKFIEYSKKFSDIISKN